MALVEMALSRILIRENSDQQVIFLKEKGGEGRTFPIIIGVFEAVEINRKITEVETPRPMTHDLVRNILHGLGAELVRVVVDELKDSTFYAKLHLRHEGEEVVIDSRPSDAIAIAVAEKAPIFVEDAVLDEVGGQTE